MKWVGVRGQQQQDFYYDASGTIATGGTAQLLLPQSKSRSHLIIINNSTGVLNIQFGMIPGVATLSGKTVASVAVSDGGFGFNVPPDVVFLGGGNSNDPASYGATMPDWPAPNAPAKAHCVMGSSAISGLTVSSIVVDYVGAGYLAAPYAAIIPQRTDPTGVGTASTNTWPIMGNGGAAFFDGSTCPTDAISIWGATTSQAFICKWMT